MAKERARRRAASTGGAPRASAAARETWRAPVWLAPLAAAAVAIVLHAGALTAPFFADDWLFLDLVRSRSLLATLAAPDPIGNFFRPLGRQVWFWLLAHGTGESSVAFHAANLALFVACVLMLWAIARRVAGERTAAIAALVLALTHAADVPVRWAAGSQDLVAITLAMAATWAFVSGRRAASAALFFLAPFAKETVALAAVPAALLARRRGEPWRDSLVRAWPALAGTAAWLAIVALVAARHHGASVLTFSWRSPIAALAGLPRTLFGIEWAALAEDAPPFGSIGPRFALAGVALAALAAELPLAAAARTADDGADAPAPARVLPAAWAWMLAGALPVAFVAPIWSAYFYLYAMGGAALLVGAWCASRPRWAGVVGVAALGLLARYAGGLGEFATKPDPFSPQSHVNSWYLDRGMTVIGRAIADVRRLVPKPERGTTFFFTGVPAFAGIQTADGPVVRGVYRDSSLRSYFLSELTRAKMSRGPARFVFFNPVTKVFEDQSRDSMLFVRVALGHLLTGDEKAAREALEVGHERGQTSATSEYLAAFMAMDAGDHDAAAERFAAAGCRVDAHGDEVLVQAHGRLAAQDSVGAIQALALGIMQHATDVRLHELMADLQLSLNERRQNAAMEAYACRVLEPRDGLAWRRWAYALYWQNRYAQAKDALERYYQLAPQLASRDADAEAMRVELPRMLPGGDLLQVGLRQDARK